MNDDFISCSMEIGVTLVATASDIEVASIARNVVGGLAPHRRFSAIFRGSVAAAIAPRRNRIDARSGGADPVTVACLATVRELLDRLPAAARELVVQPRTARHDHRSARDAGP